ncbi:MAG: ATP-binding cassette domain-containing protein, partial [Clostridia bacterium]|nr:ATP-binding cassette domain-containing protein [Clostridia bacterium]
KSTLLRIILGTQTPTSGSVFYSKDKTIGMLEQNAMLDSSETVFDEMAQAFEQAVKTEKRLEELTAEIEKKASAPHDAEYDRLILEYTSATEKFKDLGGYEYRSRIKSMLAKFGFGEDSLNKKIPTLSGGERTRLALIKLLLTEPDILMLDEPTNHLDTDTMAWLEEHLASYPKTLIIVSHDRYFLDKTATKMLNIEHTEATIYPGNYSAFVSQKELAEKTLGRLYDRQQKEIARIEGIIAQQITFGQERNYVTIASKQKQIEHMKKVEAPKSAPKTIRMAFSEAGDSGNDVIMCERLSKSFGQRTVLNGIDFLVRKRDKIVIVGPNGCGKSTLIKIIGGLIEADDGICEFGANVIVGYYDQEQQTLNESNTVLQELYDAHEDLTITEIRSALASFLFFAEDIEKSVSQLSGGEKARLMLCKMILSKVNVLILDEPTNHLDIGSREALENALCNFGGTVISVSHDRYFIKKTANRIFDMRDGFTDYKCGYDEYLERVSKKDASASVAASTEKAESENKARYFENKKLQSDMRKAAARIERNETKITELEEEKSSLEKEAQAEAATDYVRLNEITDRINEIDSELDTLYTDCVEAEELLNSLKEKA